MTKYLYAHRRRIEVETLDTGIAPRKHKKDRIYARAITALHTGIADLQSIADIPAGRTHDLDRVCDLLLAARFDQNAIMDQHVRHDAGFTHSPRGQAQHFRPFALHWKVIERALVWAGTDTQWPTEGALDASIQHGCLHHIGAPLPESRIRLPVLLDDDGPNPSPETAHPSRNRSPTAAPSCAIAHPDFDLSSVCDRDRWLARKCGLDRSKCRRRDRRP